MKRLDFCSLCGIPLYVGKLHEWMGNGVIVQNIKATANVFFLESENIDTVFRTLDRELGVSIEDIVMECTRRGNRRFMEENIPAPLRRFLSYVPRLTGRLVSYSGRAVGFGASEYLGARRKGDKRDCLAYILHDPYSLTSLLADALGVAEAFTGKDGIVDSFPLGDDSYLMIIRAGEHRSGLEERLRLQRLPLKEFDSHVPRCGRCRLPLELSERYVWDMEKGFILSRASGRRMVITGFDNYEAVFREIEGEVGQEISQAIVDAQRLFVRETAWEENWLENEGALQRNLGLRGLGYVTAFSREDAGISLSIANCLIPKQVVGMLQGFYELQARRDNSDCSWSVAEGGDLKIEFS